MVSLSLSLDTASLLRALQISLGLLRPAAPLGAPGCFGAMGTRWLRIEPLSPVPNPPTTRGAAGVLGEAQAMAPQVAFSVYSVSVIYLRRMLILGSSNRGGVLAGTRYTPNTLTLDDGEVCLFQPFPGPSSPTMGEGIEDFIQLK